MIKDYKEKINDLSIELSDIYLNASIAMQNIKDNSSDEIDKTLEEKLISMQIDNKLILKKDEDKYRKIYNQKNEYQQIINDYEECVRLIKSIPVFLESVLANDIEDDYEEPRMYEGKNNRTTPDDFIKSNDSSLEDKGLVKEEYKEDNIYTKATKVINKCYRLYEYDPEETEIIVKDLYDRIHCCGLNTIDLGSLEHQIQVLQENCSNSKTMRRTPERN